MSKTRISNDSYTPQKKFDIDALKNPIRPEWFQGVYEARLGRAVEISQFGVNKVTLLPGSYSSLRHWHEQEDEFVLVLDGVLTLLDDNGEHELAEGSFVGFKAGEANAHHLANRSDSPATYLAVGTRRPELDLIHYPDDRTDPVRR